MSAVDKLIAFILSLTPEQVEKILNHLPELLEAISKQDQPFPPEQSLQKQ